MNATPVLAEIGRRLNELNLEAVLIGNAAAALQGALLVASLADVIRSKKAARRPRDLAVLEILERALEEASKPAKKARRARARK